MEYFHILAIMVMTLVCLQGILVYLLNKLSGSLHTAYGKNLKKATHRVFLLSSISSIVLTYAALTAIDLNDFKYLISVIFIEVILNMLFIVISTKPKSAETLAQNFNGFNLLYFGGIIYIMFPASVYL